MTPEAPPIALHCEGLSKSFGAATAVDDASFHVRAGSILALLGPSGCGKTTTLRLIAGLDQPDAGMIVLGGSVVQGPDVSVPPERRRVGLVFQDYALFPHLDVRANVGFGLSRRNGRAARVAETLELVGLSALASRMPHELSGGQQQRVALARALAPNPRVVLLDEPFSNLDAALRNDLRNDVRRVLRESGTTAVFVTHDQEEALSLADRVAVMIDGRVLQVAPPHEIYRQPVGRAVADFIGQFNVIEAAGIGRAVVCDLGTVTIPEPMIGTVDLYVRPEALQISEDPSGQGVIESRRFFGHDQLVRVRFDSGLTVECRAGPTFLPPPGTRARVQLDGDVLAFLRAGVAPRRQPGAAFAPPAARGRPA
ncbi:MAG: ABC transporter ATP-binding protein [Chloroflexi bacterium]|nr:ABC transporter ATP-binding protein [Chloroflexota bacterium]